MDREGGFRMGAKGSRGRGGGTGRGDLQWENVKEPPPVGDRLGGLGGLVFKRGPAGGSLPQGARGQEKEGGGQGGEGLFSGKRGNGPGTGPWGGAGSRGRTRARGGKKGKKPMEGVPGGVQGPCRKVERRTKA